MEARVGVEKEAKVDKKLEKRLEERVEERDSVLCV